jgi:hypothetical protein
MDFFAYCFFLIHLINRSLYFPTRKYFHIDPIKTTKPNIKNNPKLLISESSFSCSLFISFINKKYKYIPPKDANEADSPDIAELLIIDRNFFSNPKKIFFESTYDQTPKRIPNKKRTEKKKIYNILIFIFPLILGKEEM